MEIEDMLQLEEHRMSDIQRNIMNKVTNKIYSAMENFSLDRTSQDSLKMHLCSMDYIAGNVNDDEFVAEFMKNRWGRYSDN